MRKILLLLLAFVSLTLTLKAQTQSLEDMKLQLEQSDTLYEAEKYDEVHRNLPVHWEQYGAV